MNYCSTCGIEILKNSRFRPAFYCSADCRNFVKYKNAIERILVDLEPTHNARSLIRGDMFRLANILSCGTKTLNLEDKLLERVS